MIPQEISEISTDTYFENHILSMSLEEGIMYAHYKKGAYLDLEATKDILKERIRISKDIDRPMYIDANLGHYWTKESKKFLSSLEIESLPTTAHQP